MAPLDVIRAWKDPIYRATLSEAELAALPSNPAGLIEVTDEDLDAVAGGQQANHYNTTDGQSFPGCPRPQYQWGAGIFGPTE